MLTEAKTINQVSDLNLKKFNDFRLIVIQATSFCNLDCDYCYLPHRQLKNTISLEVIEQIFYKIFTSPFFNQDLTISWHAGEPLSVPREFYQSAVELINNLSAKYNTKGYKIRQSLQTNGTLINQAWCNLFKKYNFQIGVSIDGPQFIHDAHRKDRQGKGSHKAAMRGVSLLKKNKIPFSIISVVTENSLDYPDEIFNFFAENGITRVAFNVEEVEGTNASSSLQNQGCDQRVKAFFKRFWELKTNYDKVLIQREFEKVSSLIYHQKTIDKNPQNLPFAIITIDYQGNFTTFSPELITMKSDIYGDFIVGNLMTDTFESVCDGSKFKQMLEDISVGVEMCRNTCEYFNLCGGGAPSNKYYENGTFRSTETLTCRYHEKFIIDIILEHLEQSLGLNSQSIK